MADKLSDLEQRLTRLEELVARLGLDDFLPVTTVAKLMQRTPESIRKEIRIAERLRLTGKSPKLQFGYHYRSKSSEGAYRETWEVHYSRYKELKSKPRESA